jgi:hypothetical protein
MNSIGSVANNIDKLNKCDSLLIDSVIILVRKGNYMLTSFNYFANKFK